VTEPDEASVWISLQASSDAPGSAFEAVALLSERLAGILDEMVIAANDRAETGVNVGEETTRPKDASRSDTPRTEDVQLTAA
jgi:hypothetical protein